MGVALPATSDFVFSDGWADTSANGVVSDPGVPADAADCSDEPGVVNAGRAASVGRDNAAPGAGLAAFRESAFGGVGGAGFAVEAAAKVVEPS